MFCLISRSRPNAGFADLDLDAREHDGTMIRPGQDTWSATPCPQSTARASSA
jgi:hypothetical protein